MVQRRKMPEPGSVRLVLTAVERNFPNFHSDPEMRKMALIALGQCVGAVAGWTFHLEGPDSCEKALRMIYAMAFHTAEQADAHLRDRQSRMTIDEVKQ
jgi:hypothetical protein